MTHPIAKAIAERMRPYTAVYDLVADVEAGAIDDLLPAYTTEVATVGNTRYLMPSEPLYLADASNLTTADGRIVEWRPTQPPTSWWRMVAVMRERLRAGESVESVAADYGTPEDVVTMLADAPAGRPVLSDECIDELLSAHIAAGEPRSVVEQYEERAVTKRKPEYAAKCGRIAAELRAWEAWKKEGGA